jgi:hypothetical protein
MPYVPPPNMASIYNNFQRCTGQSTKMKDSTWDEKWAKKYSFPNNFWMSFGTGMCFLYNTPTSSSRKEIKNYEIWTYLAKNAKFSVKEYNTAILYQNAQQSILTNMYKATTAIINGAALYLPKTDSTTMLSTVKSRSSLLPYYVQGTGPKGGAEIIYYEVRYGYNCHNCCTYKNGWGETHHEDCTKIGYNKMVGAYIWSKNANFSTSIQAAKDANTTMLNRINNLIYNNCDNDNTLLNATGLQTCINDAMDTYRESILYYKTQSNNVMSKITNTSDFPQYAQAKAVDDTINAAYGYDPMAIRSAYNTEYASLTKTKILAKIALWTTDIPKLYDDCGYIGTWGFMSHVGLNNNDVPNCVTTAYMNTSKTCGEAITMSKNNANYGLEKLTDLWTDVSNSIPGNMVTQSGLILNASTESCTKWINMFNQWEAAENAALSAPCLPERPIASTNDPVLIKKANEWSLTATSRIKQLKERLRIIQKYIQNYPNILQLKQDDVTLAPYSLPVTAIIKKDYKNSKNGESPMQYLEMIIPNGKPGETGIIGIIGPKGKPGKDGIKGPEGKPGNRMVPHFYNNQLL